MGSNFLVASMIPSLAFILSFMFVINRGFPHFFGFLQQNQDGLDMVGIFASGIVILVCTTILGFTLTTLNTFFLKVFEGYILIWRFPVLRRFEMRRYQKQKKQIEVLGKRIERLRRRLVEAQDETRRKKALDAKFHLLNAKRNKLITINQITFPPAESGLMPLRFGNLLKAAEAYTTLRYKADAIPLWPRLLHVIPPSYYNHIEMSLNELSFLLNCTILSLAFSVLCVLAGLLTSTHIAPDSTLDTRLCLLGFVASLGMAVVFNRAAQLSVSGYGQMITSAFDLFRFDLLKQFHLNLPDDIDKERIIWKKVSDFIDLGFDYVDKVRAEDAEAILTYEHAPKKNSRKHRASRRLGRLYY
jgi:hypothetical protein